MNRWTMLLMSLLISTLMVMGCSSGGGNAVAPTTPNLTGGAQNAVATTQTHLWGYYDIYIDVANQKVEVVPNHSAQFMANVTQFVNGKPANLGFAINGTPVMLDYIDVDIDVSITHPFPGLTMYNGYDVKGVFMGIGSQALNYNNDLVYAVAGDQEMYDFNPDGTDTSYTDPHAGPVGMPDGYTRWFNPTEFTAKGLFGYTQGKLATPNYQASISATLNPYKFYCDGLGVEDNLWTWLNDTGNADGHAVFSAGTKNTRNYYLRFPNALGVKYGYAVIASWEGEGPEFHPANAAEAAACSVNVTPDIYFVDNTDKGGDLILDMSLWGWDYQPSTIYVESSVLSSVANFDPSTIATGGTGFVSTYHVDIPADNIGGLDGNEFWVIAEYGDFDYANDYGVSNNADGALAAFFRYDLYVSPEAYCDPPIVDSIDPLSGPEGQTASVTITGTFIDGSMLGATLKMTGQTDIVGTNAMWVDDNTMTVDFDLTDAELGFWDVVCTHDECDKIATLPAAFEVVEAVADIVQWDGAPLGAGPKLITVKGTDWVGDDGAGGPIPPHGDFIIDLGVRPNDGGVFLAWAQHKTWANASDAGYVDRYQPDMNSVIGCIPNFQYGRTNPIAFAYRDFQLDAGGPSTSYGWGAKFSNAFVGGPENMTVPATDVGMGYTMCPATWDFWNISYGNAPYYYGCSVGATGCADGKVYTLSAKYNGSGGNVVRTYGFVPASSGDWSHYASYSEGGLNYAYVGNDNFDGGSTAKVRGVAMGSNKDSVFFGLTDNSPHIVKYANSTAQAISGTGFGVDGTELGQVKTPIDITIRFTADRIYVLDQPETGKTRIQCFDTAGTLLAWSAVTDASATGGAAPYRMDYNEFDDCLYVLYDNNTIEAWIDNSL